MIDYCLGFAFDRSGNVALIQKQRPDWMKGKWNGIGGKIESFDTDAAAAMVREFYEETGMQTLDYDWKILTTVTSEFYQMTVFYGVFDKITGETKTDEIVSIWNMELARTNYVYNVFETDCPWLMEMAYRNVKNSARNVVRGSFYTLL
jgi:8-oxo-dGTP diphosphatase